MDVVLPFLADTVLGFRLQLHIYWLFDSSSSKLGSPKRALRTVSLEDGEVET